VPGGAAYYSIASPATPQVEGISPTVEDDFYSTGKGLTPKEGSHAAVNAQSPEDGVVTRYINARKDKDPPGGRGMVGNGKLKGSPTLNQKTPPLPGGSAAKQSPNTAKPSPSTKSGGPSTAKKPKSSPGSDYYTGKLEDIYTDRV